MASQEQPRLRPIAPKAITGGLSSLATTPAPEAQRATRASQACQACKKQRTKCVSDTRGGPCTKCVRERTKCIIDKTSDRRCKVSVKRTEENLKYYKDFSDGIVQVIRDGEMSDVDTFISTIRAGATRDEIHAITFQSVERLAQRQSSSNNATDWPAVVVKTDGMDTVTEMYTYIRTPKDGNISDSLSPNGLL